GSRSTMVRRTGTPRPLTSVVSRSIRRSTDDGVGLRHHKLHELVNSLLPHLNPLPLSIEDLRCLIPVLVDTAAAGVMVHRLQEPLLVLRSLGARKRLERDSPH